MGSTRSKAIRRLVIIALQLAVAAMVLTPFFWMFSVSLKPATEPFAIPAKLWPDHPTLENYVLALRPEFLRYFLNSIIVCGGTVAVTVPLALLCAYSLSRYQHLLLSAFFAAVLLAQFFPSSAIIIPIYSIMKNAGLLNSYASLIVAYITITLPVSIWMLRAFIGTIPVSLEEAASIDGAGPLRIFFTIIVPLSRNGIAATIVFALIVTWQEFLFALSFTTTSDMRTLPVGVNDYIGQYGIQYGELMASSVLISAPVAVIYFVLQRQFVAGLTAGSVKG